MPAVMRYILPNDPQRFKPGVSSEDVFGNERKDRENAFKFAEKYYYGDHKPMLAVEDPGGDFAPVDYNVVVNAVRKAVDRTLSFLFPSMPRFEFQDNEKPSPVEKWLSDAWRENNGPFFLNTVAYNGANSGHAFVKVMPPSRAGRFPRLINLHPASIIAFWKADDIDQVIFYEIRWKVGKVEYLQDIYRPDPTDDSVWYISDYQRDGGTEWQLISNVRYAYPFCPITAWQHLPNPNHFYGKPEITDDIIRLNDQLNFVASNVNKILAIHASPRTIATGVDAGEIQATAVNTLWTVTNPDATITNLEMKSDLASSMAIMQYFEKAIMTTNRVVILDGQVKDFQRVTNAGIRAVFLDMIAKNYLLRWSYGRGLQELSYKMMVIANQAVTNMPDVIWPDPLPEDETETVNVMALELALKTQSLQQAIHERGRSVEETLGDIKAESKMEFLQPKEQKIEQQGANDPQSGASARLRTQED